MIVPRLTGRIFLKLIAVDFMASRIAEETYVDTLKTELTQKGRILALDEALLRDKTRLAGFAHAAGGRISIVRRDGTVLA